MVSSCCSQTSKAHPDSLTLTLSVLKGLSSLDPGHSSFIPTSEPLPLQFIPPGALSPYCPAPFSFYKTSLQQLFFKFHSRPSHCSALGRL